MEENQLQKVECMPEIQVGVPIEAAAKKILLEDFIQIVPEALHSGIEATEDNFERLFSQILPTVRTQDAARLRVLYSILKHVDHARYRGFELKVENYPRLFSDNHPNIDRAATALAGGSEGGRYRLLFALAAENLDALLSGKPAKEIAHEIGIKESYAAALVSELNRDEVVDRQKISYDDAKRVMVTYLKKENWNLENLEQYFTSIKNRKEVARKIAERFNLSNSKTNDLLSALNPKRWAKFYSEQFNPESIGVARPQALRLASSLESVGLLYRQASLDDLKEKILKIAFPNEELPASEYKNRFSGKRLFLELADALAGYYGLSEDERSFLSTALKPENFDILSDDSVDKKEKAHLMGREVSVISAMINTFSKVGIHTQMSEDPTIMLYSSLYGTIRGQPRQNCDMARLLGMDQSHTWEGINELVEKGLVDRTPMKKGVKYSLNSQVIEAKVLEFLRGDELPTLKSLQNHLPFRYEILREIVFGMFDDTTLTNVEIGKDSTSLDFPKWRLKSILAQFEAEGMPSTLYSSLYSSLLSKVVSDFCSGELLYFKQMSKRWNVPESILVKCFFSGNKKNPQKTIEGKIDIAQENRVFSVFGTGRDSYLDISYEKVGRLIEASESYQDFMEKMRSKFMLDRESAEELVRFSFPYARSQIAITKNYNAVHNGELGFNAIVERIVAELKPYRANDPNPKNRNFFCFVRALNQYADEPLSVANGLFVYQRFEYDARFEVLENQLKGARLAGKIDFETVPELISHLNSPSREAIIKQFNLKESPLLGMLTDPEVYSVK